MRRALHFGVLVAIVSLMCCGAVRAQSGFVAVTAAPVLDPNGVPYTNCQASISFVPSPSATLVPTIYGSTFPTSYPVFTCDSFGNFSANLPDNNLIVDGHTSSPASLWRFNICSAPGKYPGPQYCFNTALTITGGTQNITSALQAAAAILPATTTGTVTSVGCVPTGTITCVVTNPTTHPVLTIGGGAGTGTVTSVSCTAGSNVTCSVANPTTTPNITVSATGGSGSPAGPNTSVQVDNSGAFGSLNGSTSDAAGDLTLGANLHQKGPSPTFDVTAYGASGSNNYTTTSGGVTGGATTIPLSSAIDFANGEGLMIGGAGPVNTLATPTGAAGLMIGATGSTSHTYCISAIDSLRGASPKDCVTISNEPSTLTATNYLQGAVNLPPNTQFMAIWKDGAEWQTWSAELPPIYTITTITNTGGVTTANVNQFKQFAPHGNYAIIGSQVTVTGSSVSAYNGTWTVTGASFNTGISSFQITWAQSGSIATGTGGAMQ